MGLQIFTNWITNIQMCISSVSLDVFKRADGPADADTADIDTSPAKPTRDSIHPIFVKFGSKKTS